MFEEVKPHLVELRKRIFISVVALVVSFILSFIFYKPILDWVTAPLFDALQAAQKSVKKTNEGVWEIDIKDNNITLKEKNITKISLVQKAINEANRVINDKNSTKTEIALANSIKDLATHIKSLKAESNNSVMWGSVTTRQIGGVFMVALKVSLYASIFLALPIILWQAWLFVAPGLYDNEKKLALPFLFGVTIMFIVGVLFAYYVVAPFGFQFLITFGAFLYTPLINIEDYIGFFAKILFGFGLAFELPMVVYFLALIGLVTDKTLIAFFKYAIVLIFIIAAILTPPDIITQLLMATPLIVLYGVSILIARVVNPAKDDEDEDLDDKKLLENEK
ncbi:MAG: twin-arginine translocase subunit TatC [Epsilonproteobacteria bacterium]|nr:twin-arginine translocase subunit TatC [Campylobacterota bacterium]